MDYKNLRTVAQIARLAAPIITEGKLRWWIFHASQNGLAKAIVRIGGRVYLDVEQFNNWLDTQRAESLEGTGEGQAPLPQFEK